MTDFNPCAGCYFAQGFERELPKVQEAINQIVVDVGCVSESLPVGDEAIALEFQERKIGALGVFLDSLSVNSLCAKPKLNLRIGRLSLVNVCGMHWNDGSRLGAILSAVNPTIINTKANY